VDRYLTTNDVIELTTLSRATIERKVKAGDLPAPIYLSARRKAFRESQIRAWMASKEQAAA
jgi:prophage regulatory protein